MSVYLTWLKRLSGNVCNCSILFILVIFFNLVLSEFGCFSLLSHSLFSLNKLMSSIVVDFDKHPWPLPKLIVLQLHPRLGVGCDKRVAQLLKYTCD